MLYQTNKLKQERTVCKINMDELTVGSKQFEWNCDSCLVDLTCLLSKTLDILFTKNSCII